jgi:hypothetical protein
LGIQQTIADFLSWKVETGEAVENFSPLFVSQRDGHLTRQGLFDLVKRMFEKAGIDQSPHALRKTGATIYYIESNYDLIATQLFLGHADPSTTRRYIGLTSQQIAEYAERMSDHLFSAIENGTLDTNGKMSRDSLDDISDEKLIFELIKRGFAVSEQPKKQELPEVSSPQKRAKIIQMPKIA